MRISDVILKRINQDFVLPSIQREFVWLNSNDKKVEKLFDSILQEYPFGTILTWEIDKPIDSTQINWEVYKFIQDYDDDNPHNKPANINGYSKLNLVLDGQQRLSALNLGLRGVYSYTSRKKKKQYKLYLNLFSDIENDPDNNYGLKYEFEFLEKAPDSDDTFWFEVGRVLDFHDKNTEVFKESFDSQIRAKGKSPEQIINAKMILGQLHKTVCSDDSLKIIPFSGDDEKALNVFVRTNDGGIKLEKADLLLSFMESNKQLFQPIGARKEIFGFVDSLNKEELHKPNYDFAKDDILKASLVLSNLEVQYKLKNFNEGNLKTISDNWATIKKYTELTVKLIARYGFSSKNILSKNSLIPIAYYLLKKNASPSFIASQSTDDLQLKNEIIKWLVISQLTGAFGSSSDTTLKSVRESIDNGKSFLEINLGKKIEKDDVEKWVNREQYGSRFSHLILLLISRNKYWDECHQDHIFPKSKFDLKHYGQMKLNDKEIEYYEANANAISNLHLLNPSVNIVKSNDDFIEWQNDQNTDFLESSLIPMNIDLDFKNFKEFNERRKAMMIDLVFNTLSSKS